MNVKKMSIKQLKQQKKRLKKMIRNISEATRESELELRRLLDEHRLPF